MAAAAGNDSKTNHDTRQSLLAGFYAGQSRQQQSDLGGVDMQELIARMQQIQQQRADNRQLADQLQTRVTHLNVLQESLTNANDDLQQATEQVRRQLREEQRTTRALQQDVCCLSGALVATGLGLTGAGAAVLAAKQGVQLGVTLISTGAPLVGGGACAAKKDCAKQ